jgi:sugar phosphate isomerase/epimerase
MSRPVTLFTGQWADMPLEDLARKASEFGYQGLELACWGDHFDVTRALEESGYCAAKRDTLERNDLSVYAISCHLVGQAVCDRIDERHQAILPPHVWGDGDPAGVNERAAEEIKRTARAAQQLGVSVVNGFTGSSIWHLLYSFPPVPDSMLDAGFQEFADRWNPILDVFAECGVRFALEVHPTEIIRTFHDRIYHVHIKDAAVTLNGRGGILGSHLNFGDPRRGWDFRSPGRGGVDFEEIIRALNQIGYEGPLSVEWEDCGMDREHGAAEAAEFVHNLDFAPSRQQFDSAFAKES